MKILLPFLVFIILGGFLYAPKAHAITRDELVQTARRVEQRKAQQRVEKEFNQRVQSEANRLGVGNDPARVSVIADILKTFGMGIEGRTALAVAKGESGFRCEAINHNSNGTTDHGPMQINSIHSWRGNIKDCRENIKIAYQIYKEQSFRPWVVFSKGIYKQWM